MQIEILKIPVKEPWGKEIAGKINNLANEIAIVYWGTRILKVGANKGEHGKTADPEHVEMVKTVVKEVVRHIYKPKGGPIEITTFKTLDANDLGITIAMLNKWLEWITTEKAKIVTE